MPGTKTCCCLRWPSTGAVILVAACAIFQGPARSEGIAPLGVKVRQNTNRLMPYQVFELTFQHEAKHHDPTWDVTIEVAFTAPSGNKVTVGGFFYGSSKPPKPVVHGTPGARGYTSVWPCEPADLWKARFAPAELGRWTFAYRFQELSGRQATGSGSFEVVKGRVHQKGFVRISPHNPFRFVFDDGSPYFPIGFQDCIFDGNHNGSVLDQMAMEGPFRLDKAAQRPAPPRGPLFARGPSMNPQNGDVKFGRMARAGFNLWRFSPHNCSIRLFASPQDAWPLEREEWADADADRIGDNLDADIDADGHDDDRNGNGLPDGQERDGDHDGVPTAEAIPWDAFPRDPNEWRDTDGDGLGDNQDPDDDGDGYSDEHERRATTDPLDAMAFPP